MNTDEFQSEVNNPVDRILREHLVQPMSRWIPRRITPNSITLTTPLLTISALTLAWYSRDAEPNQALIARVVAALLSFGSLISDHLDGAHARNTGQTSKLGEILDHWLDALNVPILVAILSLGVGMESWGLLPPIIAGSMIYNAQLSLYHRTGRFIYPKIGGAGPQAIMSISLATSAFILYALPADATWLPKALIVLGLIIAIGELDSVVHYLRHPEGRVLPVLSFALANVLWCIPVLRSQVDDWTCIVMVCAVSWHTSGRYVIRAVLKEPCPQVDVLTLVLGIVVAGSSLANWAVQPVLTGALLLVGAASIREFVRAVGALTSRESSAPTSA